MDDLEKLMEEEIERDVIIYVRFPSTATDEEVHAISETLYEFCDMLGATVTDHFWEVADDHRKQHKLSKALSAMNKTKYKELVTYDLSTLTPELERSVKLSEQVMADGGFVYYVDDESVLMECQALMNYNSEDDTVN